MGKIVLTTDLSDESLRAFGPTGELAQKLGHDIVLLHVVQEIMARPHGAPLAPVQAPPDTGEDVEAAEKKLGEFRGQLPADVNVTAEVRVAEDAAKEIAAFAESVNAAAIALSTHGRSGLRRLVLGSIAEQIVRHATRPVICIPPTSA